MKVYAIKVNDDGKKESDKDSKGDSMEKMPKKNVRKFVYIENKDKLLQSAFENETSDSRKNDAKKKHWEMISS